MKPKRSSIRLVYDLLSLLQRNESIGMKFTMIIQKANLSTESARKFVGFCAAKGWLERRDVRPGSPALEGRGSPRYFITDQGKSILATIEQFDVALGGMVKA